MESVLGRRRRRKQEKIPVLYWFFKNNCVLRALQGTFRTQSYWSFITGQCDYSEQLLPVHISCRMCVQFAFYHQFWINTWRSKVWATDRQYSFCLWIPWTKITRILMWSTWKHRVLHNTCTTHGRGIKTRYIGVDIILQLRKDWNSIRLDRMQSSYKKHLQLIVFRKLLGWKLEKSCTRKCTCHLGLHQRSPETRMEKRIGFRTCSTTRSWATIWKFPSTNQF